MIYTHVLNRGPAGVRSPLDGLAAFVDPENAAISQDTAPTQQDPNAPMLLGRQPLPRRR